MPTNVQSPHNPRKAKCAMTAEAPSGKACDLGRMPKAHPRRPHLRAWRDHLGKTQEWLANELGTSHSSVVRWEAQTIGVDDETFAAIAAAYGITVAELSDPPSERVRARDVGRILEALKNLDDAALSTVATLAEQLKRR